MKIIKIILISLSMILALISLMSCANVTETGNPEQPQAAEPFYEPTEGRLAAYQNDSFGVLIEYPEGWSFEESEDKDLVLFESPYDGTSHVTTASVSFEILSPVPVSLSSYLSSKYPGRVFLYYTGPEQDGYLYDNPAAGPNGGDLREYFFLHEDLLVSVDAEIFDQQKNDFLYMIGTMTYL